MAAGQARRWTAPPAARRADGAIRRVGVEIEFAGLGVAQAAEAVRAAFGGAIREDDPYAMTVVGAAFGDFRVELDMALAHRRVEDEIGRLLRDVAVEIGAQVVPVEIVCPPIPWDAAHALDELRARLHRMGAEGTRDSLFYAFGAQLNVEPPSLAPRALRDHLRAFALLLPWLREEIEVDTLRALWVFAAPWPEDYVALILEPGYDPGLDGLADDYLAFNPTRDRALDALPLLAWLDEARVRAALPAEKIRPRPAWHYRLPNSEINAHDWSIGLEWDRWLRVERLAADPARLAAAAAAWRANAAQFLPADWTPRAREIAAALETRA